MIPFGGGISGGPRGMCSLAHVSDALGMKHLVLSREPAKGLELQVHHLISLGGWNDVIYLSICLCGARPLSKSYPLYLAAGLVRTIYCCFWCGVACGVIKKKIKIWSG